MDRELEHQPSLDHLASEHRGFCAGTREVWICRLEAWVAAYASAEEPLQALEDEGSYSDFDLNALRRVRVELSGVWIEVRVSGRGDFHAEMRQLVVWLLTDGGYAFDDHSPGLWSLEEIHLGRADGQLFRA